MRTSLANVGARGASAASVEARHSRVVEGLLTLGMLAVIGAIVLPQIGQGPRAASAADAGESAAMEARALGTGVERAPGQETRAASRGK